MARVPVGGVAELPVASAVTASAAAAGSPTASATARVRGPMSATLHASGTSTTRTPVERIWSIASGGEVAASIEDEVGLLGEDQLGAGRVRLRHDRCGVDGGHVARLVAGDDSIGDPQGGQGLADTGGQADDPLGGCRRQGWRRPRPASARPPTVMVTDAVDGVAAVDGGGAVAVPATRARRRGAGRCGAGRSRRRRRGTRPPRGITADAGTSTARADYRQVGRGWMPMRRRHDSDTVSGATAAAGAYSHRVRTSRVLLRAGRRRWPSRRRCCRPLRSRRRPAMPGTRAARRP